MVKPQSLEEGFSRNSAGDSSPPRAPLGIKLYCIITAFAIVYTTFLGITVLNTGDPHWAFGAIILLITAGFLAMIYGLWRVKPWGWKLGMALLSGNVLLASAVVDLLGIAVSAILLGYLYLQKPLYSSPT